MPKKKAPRKVVDLKDPPSKAPASKRGTNSRPGRRIRHGCAFTNEVRASIIGKVRKGMPRKYAAEASGISDRTIQRWIAKGRDNLRELDEAQQAMDEGATSESASLNSYGEFVLDVVEAEAEIRGEQITKILEADDWRASSWYLERTDNRNFGSYAKSEQVVTGEDGEQASAVDLLMEKLDLQAEREERAKAVAEDDGDLPPGA